MAKLVPGVNDLATLFPEVAKEADGWDPKVVTTKANKKLAWRCKAGHNFEARVADRTRRNCLGCPVCSGKQLLAGVNDLATLFPEVGQEAEGWDPSSVSAKSNKKLGWKCKKGHTWLAVVGTRTPPVSASCPYCSGTKVLPGFNDLKALFPEVAAEASGWEPTTVTAKSGAKKLWSCKKGHFWEARVYTRTPPVNAGCPFCSGRLVVTGVNDLASLFPKLASQAKDWDPRTVKAGSDEKKSWVCELGHTWTASVVNRTPPHGRGCPYCSGNKVLPGFNDLSTLQPRLAREAEGWEPSTVTSGSRKRLSWRCAVGHTWLTSVSNRVKGTGCPYCAEFGFKRSEPAWFYLLGRPGEQQLGVTNNAKVRLRTHARSGWYEVEVLGPFPGEETLEAESALKRWLKAEVGLVPGTNENWFTAKLEVKSLAELKELSGVETDLF